MAHSSTIGDTIAVIPPYTRCSVIDRSACDVLLQRGQNDPEFRVTGLFEGGYSSTKGATHRNDNAIGSSYALVFSETQLGEHVQGI